FTRSGDAKEVPLALVKRAKKFPLRVNVFTGASLGSDIDKLFAENEMLLKRLPFQADRTMRNKINEGAFHFVDPHLSHVAELIRADLLGKIDYAIIEAVAITDDGLIIP